MLQGCKNLALSLMTLAVVIGALVAAPRHGFRSVWRLLGDENPCDEGRTECIGFDSVRCFSARVDSYATPLSGT